jgi:hypothetical protein
MSDAVIARFPLREVRTPVRARTIAGLAFATVIAIVALAITSHPWFASAVFACAAGLGAWSFRRSRAVTHGFIDVYAWGVTREDEHGTVRLLAFGEPFGVALLADHARAIVLLAFTTPTYTRYVSVRANDGPPSILARATTIAESDAAALSANFALSGEDARTLLRMIEHVAPRAMERMFLNGSRGERIAIDPLELRVDPLRDTGSRTRGRAFDLRAPLEWRGFMFHESVGPVTTLYQATWVRQQGCGEIVFVAPMPHVLASYPDRRASVEGDDVAQVVRDLELLQSLPDAAPPRELRTAIERAFMLPLRQALDRAPRAARSAPPTRLQSSPDHV